MCTSTTSCVREVVNIHMRSRCLRLLIYICMMNIKIKHVFQWILANWTSVFNKNAYSTLLPTFLSHTKLSAFTAVYDGYKYSYGTASINYPVFANYIFCCDDIFKLHLSRVYSIFYLSENLFVVVVSVVLTSYLLLHIIIKTIKEFCLGKV